MIAQFGEMKEKIDRIKKEKCDQVTGPNNLILDLTIEYALNIASPLTPITDILCSFSS